MLRLLRWPRLDVGRMCFICSRLQKTILAGNKADLLQDPKKRNIILKTFILLSSTVSALPFKFGADTDDKFSCEMMDTFAGLVRDRFENRLL